MEREPTSLQEAILYFSNPASCRDYLVKQRWPIGKAALAERSRAPNVRL